MLFTSGVFTGVLIGRIWEISFGWDGQDRIETNGVGALQQQLLQQCHPFEGGWKIWETIGELVEFSVIPLLQMNGKKVHFCPFSSFFVPFWDSLYICPLFSVFLLDIGRAS